MSSADYSNVDPLGCVGDETVCPVRASIYGYRPSLAGTVFFIIVFGACGLANLGLGIKYRTWTYMVATCLGCLAMVIGYAGRVLLHNNPFGQIGFQIQICCLTLAPAFNSAAIYLILKHVVRTFGREFSRIRPKYYTWGFILADVAALTLQGAGGGIAATAEDDGMLNVGDGLMMAGIAWQVATLVIFGAAVSDFLVRRYRAGTVLSPIAQATFDDVKFKTFAVGVFVAYVTILIRCIYRIIEMAGGWRNSVMQDQVLFIVLESVMLSIAIICQTVFHPGYCFPQMARNKSSRKNAVLDTDTDSSGETIAVRETDKVDTV